VPLDRGRDPVVEVTFETEPHRIWRVRKEFRKGGAALFELSRVHLVRKCSSNSTDSRHLNEILFDTLQVFRFCVHDSLKPYAICCESYDTKLDSGISSRMSL
jgi:hypothetical protein